jgi:ABC-type glycerol-3-phosphate transport system permease component
MRKAVRIAGLGLALLLALTPFYWMVIVSLSEGAEQITLGNPWVLHAAPYFGNYLDLFSSPKFGRWMLNTVFVTGGTVVIGVAASLAAGYALATLQPSRAHGILIVLMATYVVPQTVLALPLLVEMSSLHLADNPVALLLAYPGLVIPFGTWVFWNLFSADDMRELLEQARLEGARGLGYLTDLLLPVALPAIAAVAIFAVAIVFSDYLYLFMLITSDQATTVMGGVESTNVDVEDPGFAFAAMLLGAGPAALVCAWFAERYAGGFTRALGAD